jgi:hypothetical protein
MSGSTTVFHKIWIDQCAATEDIRDHFGLQSALEYLIGEKLFSFLRAAEQDPLFAAEVADFISEIRRLFAAEVIRNYLDRLEKTKYLAPLDTDIEMDDLDELDDPDENEPLARKPSDGCRRVAALLPCPSTSSVVESHGKTKARFRPRGTHPGGNHRGCLWARGAGHGMVLLSGR